MILLPDDFLSSDTFKKFKEVCQCSESEAFFYFINVVGKSKEYARAIPQHDIKDIFDVLAGSTLPPGRVFEAFQAIGMSAAQPYLRLMDYYDDTTHKSFMSYLKRQKILYTGGKKRAGYKELMSASEAARIQQQKHSEVLKEHEKRQIRQAKITAKRGPQGNFYDRPVPPFQRVIYAYKEMKGIDMKDREWDKYNFKRFCRAAYSILAAFVADLNKSVAYVIYKGQQFDSRDLIWTLDTIAKHAWMDRSKFNAPASDEVGTDNILDNRRPVQSSRPGTEILSAGEILAAGNVLPPRENANQEQPAPILADESDNGRHGSADGRVHEKALPDLEANGNEISKDI